MFDKNEFKRLNEERDKIIDHEFLLDKAWKNTINYICKDDDNFTGFVEYMKTEMTRDEYLNLSEISMYLAGIYPSLDFVEAFKGLEKKYTKESI